MRTTISLHYYNYMETGFVNKEIVWAKVKGYPWWPAQVAKLPTPDHNVFKVVFIAQDTHAFLNPKDVRKFMPYYDECSKKKMRGLAPAIQAAQQLYKKRIQTISKTPATINNQPANKVTKTRQKPSKTKSIKKFPKDIKEQQSENDSQLSESQQKQKSVQKPEKEEIVQNQSEEQMGDCSEEQCEISEQKSIYESQEKIDRNKIQNIEENLLKIIQEVKEGTYSFKQNDFSQLTNLIPQELIQSKILNILSFITSKFQTRNSSQVTDLRWFNKLRDQLKAKTLDYLYDTSYYDQYIKLIQKNKKNRNEYEVKLTSYLKNQYRIKKQLTVIFANRLVAEINNGTISKEKELLEDIRDRKAEIININNKAAIDRCIESLIPKYI